ncbi:hypothetical protein Ae201684P_001157 [Aphanomyces euteiches]|uniref:AB hydrolase-1 domain-containing protein n=1 Tax=Aphanomyces euteiches TaxID=100861 RepID=A0A6G0WPW1_9STRA|nr:hypothetical protein Ae201684_012932 [Aphanomyces euteiches]KAH9097681.1 hypothetical protein Ae201684P_001157 [Aphanomyces euteiches]KAH9154020.1 hypothetical protein AeRB84_003819 [Aphanomyces euteiches]
MEVPEKHHDLDDALESQPYSSISTTTLPNGLRVEYALHGNDGAPEKVVLIMGLAGEKEVWTAFIATFFRQKDALTRFQILTFDNRGVGGTGAPSGRYKTSEMAQDTLMLLDHLGWTKVHLAGVSMGGMISQEIAFVAPERVQSLALIVTSPGFLEGPWPSWVQITGYLKTLSNFLATTLHERTMNMLDVLYPPDYMEDSEVSSALYKIHFERLKLSRTRRNGLMGQYGAVLTHRMDTERQRFQFSLWVEGKIVYSLCPIRKP